MKRSCKKKSFTQPILSKNSRCLSFDNINLIPSSRKPTKHGLVVRVILLSLVIFFVTRPAEAANGPSLCGTVTDRTGAVIATANVIIRGADHKFERSTTTNDAGLYTFTALPRGQFELEIHSPGFRPYSRTGLQIDADSALQVDATLDVDEHVDQVTVTEGGTHVETSTTQMGGLVTGTKIANVPLNGRSFTDLVAIQSGVVPV